MSDDRPRIKCQVECKCGWNEVFSSQFSGVIIECPECGKTHLIPTFESENLDESIDMDTMNRLLEQQQDEAPGEEPAAPARVTVPFKPLFILALGFAVVVAIVALVAVRPIVPNAVAIAGGALAWPLGISVAWLGQKRQLRKVVAAERSAD